jgi:hypothetical protein
MMECQSTHTQSQQPGYGALKNYVYLCAMALLLFASAGTAQPESKHHSEPASSTLIQPGQGPHDLTQLMHELPDRGEHSKEVGRIYLNSAAFAALQLPGGEAPIALGDKLVGGTLQVRLGPDRSWTFYNERVEQHRPEQWTWIGRTKAEPTTSLTITQGRNGYYGIIDGPSGRYVLSGGPGGVGVYSLVDPDSFPAVGRDYVESQSAGTKGFDVASGLKMSGDPTVDVMVAYTSTVAGNHADIESFISTSISNMNSSFTNSQVDGSVRLVHTEETTYSENNQSFDNVLTDLETDGDGSMDILHNLRDSWRADVVVLLVDNDAMSQNFCGIANIMSTVTTAFESDAFAVVDDACANGSYTFQHEIGHVFGGRHEWNHDSTDNEPYHYNHAHENAANDWNTIMGAYSVCGAGCARENFWSNPTQNHLGDPRGVPLTNDEPAYNTKTLNNTMSTAEDFRTAPSSPPAQPQNFVAQNEFCYGLHEVSWSAVSGPVGEYRVYASSSSSFTNQTEVYRGTNTLFFYTVDSGTEYLRARACNSAGCGTYSSTASASYYAACN